MSENLKENILQEDDKNTTLEEKNDKIQERKEKVKNWLKDKHNLAFLGVFILAFIIQLYYFNLTKNQPVWWDESDYLAYAKNLAGLPSDWIVTGAHSSLFPHIVAFLFKLGFSEAATKFVLGFIPAMLIVLLTYKICTLMYEDKKIALIASFLMATLWEFLFYSMRFHLEGPSLLFGLLAIYAFWQGYEKKEKIFGKINPNWTIPLTVFFVMVSYSIRRGFFVFGLFFLAYMLVTSNIKDLLRNKYNWIGLFMAIILLFLVENFIFPGTILSSAQNYYVEDVPLNLIALKIFKAYFENIFNQSLSILYYLFLFGALILIVNIGMHIGYVRKIKGKEAKSDIFALITIIIVISYFTFYQKRIDNFGEARWYFPLLLGAFVSISKGTLFIGRTIRRYNKYLSLLIIILLIGYGGYYELKHADFIIKGKVSSFEGIKQAGLLVRDISNKNDIILSVPEPQTIYYSERKVINPVSFFNHSGNIPAIPFEPILESIRENKDIRYLLVSFSEPNHPDWMKRQTNTIWEIPFMDTKIDFINNQQDIKQSKSYGDITFKLIGIKQDVFIYEIERSFL